MNHISVSRYLAIDYNEWAHDIMLSFDMQKQLFSVSKDFMTIFAVKIANRITSINKIIRTMLQVLAMFSDI